MSTAAGSTSRGSSVGRSSSASRSVNEGIYATFGATMSSSPVLGGGSVASSAVELSSKSVAGSPGRSVRGRRVIHATYRTEGGRQQDLVEFFNARLDSICAPQGVPAEALMASLAAPLAGLDAALRAR